MENKKPLGTEIIDTLMVQFKELKLGIEEKYNRSSKQYSEMNNTLNWATTLVIALFVFFSKQIIGQRDCIDDLFFHLSIGYFLTLIVLFALFKWKFVRHEIKTAEVINKIDQFLMQHSHKLNLGILYKENEQLNEEIINREGRCILTIKKHLNIIFHFAITIFVIAMISIAVYFILKS